MAKDYFGPGVSASYGVPKQPINTSTPFSEFRKAHPEYDGIDDMKLAGALRNKVPAYKAMPIEDFYRQIGLANLVPKKDNPTDGMTGSQKYFAGVGKFFVDSKNGVKQITGNMTREEVDAIKQRDAPLMDTTQAKFGYGSGALASVIVPGALLSRGAAAGNAAIQAGNASNTVRAATAVSTLGRNALLPTTIKGATAQGATIGALQPVGTDDSRVQNAAVGGGLGLLGQLVANGIVGGVRAARGQAVTQTGADRKVADLIRENALKGEAALMQPQPSAIPNVQRTLAEESLDDGIAGLQRTAIDPAWMTNQGRVNNAARIDYLNPIAGDESAMRQAEALREANNADAFTRARAEQFAVPTPPEKPLIVMPSGVSRPNIGAQSTADDMSPLYAQLDSIKAKFAGGDSAPVVGSWAKRIQDAKGNSLELDNIRKSIALTMRQKPEGVDIADLSQVYDALTNHLKGLSPNYREAIDGWARDSIPIDRMNIGQELVGRRGGTAVLDPVTGQQVLTPAAFSGLARDLDGVAQRATGFNRATADRYLSPDDFARISAVQDDLERQAFAQTAGGRPGSPTYDRVEMAGRIANSAVPIPQIVKDGFAVLDRIGQDRLKSKLAEVLANPQQARELLARYPASDARVIEGVLKRIGWSAGVGGTAVSTSP
jgi:hypothetical protein